MEYDIIREDILDRLNDIKHNLDRLHDELKDQQNSGETRLETPRSHEVFITVHEKYYEDFITDVEDTISLIDSFRDEVDDILGDSE